VCGRAREVVGPLSHTRLCGDCARRRYEENMDGMYALSGEPLRRWRRGVAASVGGVLLDDVQAKP